MASEPRIRTSWPQRWRRIRSQVLPVLVFGGIAVLTVRLWSWQAGPPTVVGEVEALRFDTASHIDGVLVALPAGELEPFDVVMAGELIAKLDDRPVLASLATLQADLLRIKQELAATEAGVRQQDADRQHDHEDEARRLAVDLERLRLQIVDRKALLETDRIELLRLDETYDAVREAYEQEAETEFSLTINQLQRDEVEQRIRSNTVALGEAEDQVAAAVQRLKYQPMVAPPYLEAFLAPVRAAIATQEARVRELAIQVGWLEIRSPITGTISAVYARPGQAVGAGDPILTVADGHIRHIVAYIRQHQRVEPRVGTAVEVRIRSRGQTSVQTWIDRVGAQIEPVPLHHLRDPRVLEWGLPVRIVMPPELSLRPGELVDVTFRHDGQTKVCRSLAAPGILRSITPSEGGATESGSSRLDGFRRPDWHDIRILLG